MSFVVVEDNVGLAAPLALHKVPESYASMVSYSTVAPVDGNMLICWCTLSVSAICIECLIHQISLLKSWTIKDEANTQFNECVKWTRLYIYDSSKMYYCCFPILAYLSIVAMILFLCKTDLIGKTNSIVAIIVAFLSSHF